MDFKVYWRWFAILLLCLLCMGGNVQCDCTEQGMEIEGGSYILTKNLCHGSKLIYQCPEGYYPYPAAVRSCGRSNNWSPRTKRTPQRCRNDTQNPRMIKMIENGTLNLYIAVDISESIRNEEIAIAIKTVDQLISKISSFNTNPNYEIFFFSSDIFEIVNIIDFFDPNLKPRDTMRSKLETFKLDTDRGEEVGRNLTLAFNHILNKMAYIKQQAGEAFNDHQHVIVFFTDGIYNMEGTPAPTVAKIKQLVYGPKTDSEAWKKREEYLDIYIFGIGAEVYDDDLQPLTTGTGGLHYFRLKDLNTLQQTFDEIIDEEAVKGLCGLHREYNYDGSARSTQRMYPWLASVYIKNRKCLGSLVTPKFILTAAHCFRFDDEPEDIQVEIDDGVNLVHQVDWFKLHPDFNVNAKANDGGVAEFYDYDVALIRLKEYVEISVQVRPICIPCTLETNEALGLGNSSCSQQEELLLKNELERLTFLTKTSYTIEEKDVHAKMGDNRDECISHALKAWGITTKNPKDAVTDNFLCTGGRDPFVDHIACTGDGGGAVFKNFEHRTIQIGVVSWGTKILCQRGGIVHSDDESRDFHINLFRMVPFLKEVLQNNNQTKFTPLEFLAD